MVGRVLPSITQLELSNGWDLLEIKKKPVSAYRWPSSGLILNNDLRVLKSYYKHLLLL
jgi:hypothetical protein